MAKIKNINDFLTLTSNITSFSHAYLFNVNSLDIAYPYIKEFAKLIVFDQNHNYTDTDKSLISYQIDNDEYDDLYVANPTTIGINTDEINKLMTYMETKSLRENGRRIYIIFGFERLTRDVSNKILKFLEEPNDRIYAILMTENFERILPTIVSRCQRIDLTFDNLDDDEKTIELLKKFLTDLEEKGNKMIAYEYDYFHDVLSDRSEFYRYFEVLERIVSETINVKYGYKYNNNYVCGQLLNYSNEALINILNMTNKLKCLIKGNINLNLLIDRYIIETVEELNLCKK